MFHPPTREACYWASSALPSQTGLCRGMLGLESALQQFVLTTSGLFQWLVGITAPHFTAFLKMMKIVI